MEGHAKKCVERYCELANKTTQQLKKFTHRRLEVLGANKVVINWRNGAWEVKGDEHAVLVRSVVDEFVRWFLGGTFRPRTDE